MRLIKAALDPGEYLYVRQAPGGPALDHRLIVCDESELMQRLPMPPEKRAELFLGVGPDPVGADHSFLSHATNS